MHSVQTAVPHRTYVVTYGMASRLQVLRSGGLTIPYPDNPIFKRFERGLLEKVREALPNITIHTITMDVLEQTIWERVRSRITDQVVVSTCVELAHASPLVTEGLALHFNRLFDTFGEMIGYGPRPGYDSLDKQFEELVTQIAGRSVILIEDGAFSGNTLRFILKKFSDHGLTVSTLIVGFCCTRAEIALKRVFHGELVIVDQIENLIDWIPDHDLIPFTPNCGRVLGEKTTDGFAPVRTVDGISCAYPYILPFGNVEKWSSLPTEAVRDLSMFCLDTSIEIFSRMGKDNGHRIVVGELIRNCPRISIPVRIGDKTTIPSLDREVVSFLREMKEKV